MVLKKITKKNDRQLALKTACLNYGLDPRGNRLVLEKRLRIHLQSEDDKLVAFMQVAEENVIAFRAAMNKGHENL